MPAMHVVVPMSDQSQIGQARREVVKAAQAEEWDEVHCGRAAIVTTELATNLVRYGRQGEILVRAETRNDRKSIEVYSIDRGPGISNIGRSLTDGYSTGGTSGTGLGSVQRNSDVFDIYSQAPQGTVIYCRIDQPESSEQIQSPFCFGVINCPAPYESVSGDTWRLYERGSQLSLVLVDGLGHGPEAAKASNEGAGVFDSNPFCDLGTMFKAAHQKMQGTRGGAMAAAQINLGDRTMKYLGIGNISGSLRTEAHGVGRGLLTHNGTLGVLVRKVPEVSYEYRADSLLVMYSDGLQSRWSFDAYPALTRRHPGVIAGVLYRDFCRGRDDVTVAVVRCSSWGGQN